MKTWRKRIKLHKKGIKRLKVAWFENLPFVFLWLRGNPFSFSGKSWIKVSVRFRTQSLDQVKDLGQETLSSIKKIDKNLKRIWNTTVALQ